MEKIEHKPADSAYGSTDTSQKSHGSSKSGQSSRSSSSGYDQPSTSGSCFDAESKGHKNRKSAVPRKVEGNYAESKGKNNPCGETMQSSDMKRLLLSDKMHDGSRTAYNATQLRMKGFLSKMKKLQKIYENDVLLFSNHESEPFSSFPSDDPARRPSIKSMDRFVVAATVNDGIVLHCSSSVCDLLGYPKNFWIGQNILDFVHSKDKVVFTSHINMELNLPFTNCGAESALNGNGIHRSFYCRFRVHNCELQNEDLVTHAKCATYQPFHITTRLADLNDDTYSQETNSANGSTNITYVIIIATPIKSTYHLTEEIPAMRTFTTRHSSSCIINHMDTSAIPYLGYLPQDIVGQNVFDYYHPEDLPHLLEVYQQILKEEGKLFRSKPYRFRVANGHYVLLETEWSCFINPWCRKLEFIVGQHRVLKGPKEPDVFADLCVETCPIPEEVLKESRNIQMEIQQGLIETVTKNFVDRNKESNRRVKELAKYVGNLIEEMVQTIEMDTSDKTYKEGESFSEQGSIVMGHISPHHQGPPSEPLVETLPSYHHCNYNDNIQRYFDSRPKTHSSDESAESKDRATPPVTDEEGKYSPPGSGDENVGELNQCRLSSESEKSSMRESHSPNNSGDPSNHPYIRVNLTAAILSKHNAITEKDFVQQNRESKSTNQCHHSHPAPVECQTSVNDFGSAPCGFGKINCSRRETHGVKRCGSHSPNNETHKFIKHSHMEGPSMEKYAYRKYQKPEKQRNVSTTEQAEQQGIGISSLSTRQNIQESKKANTPTTEKFGMPVTDFDDTDPEFQDDLTGSSLNSFLKSEDFSDDSTKADSRQICFPSNKISENDNWKSTSYTMIKRELQDVLKEDLELLSEMKQPSQVNDQLSQLYAEMADQQQQNDHQSHPVELDIGVDYQELLVDDILSKFFEKPDYEDEQMYLLEDFNY